MAPDTETTRILLGTVRIPAPGGGEKLLSVWFRGRVEFGLAESAQWAVTTAVTGVVLAAGIGYVRDQGTDDVDDWHVKTAPRNGEWEIPQVLRADLTWLTEGRAPDAFLLHDDCNKPHTPGWLRDLIVEVCRKATVVGQPERKVCPHGLRGTHATLLRVLLGRGASGTSRTHCGTGTRAARRRATRWRHRSGGRRCE